MAVAGKRVDVLLLFHRVDRHLESAIASIRNSIGVQARTILVDDRPPHEASIKFEPKNDQNVKYISTHGIGYSRALKVGLKSVESPFVAFLDSDDETHSTRLYQQIDELEKTRSDISITALRKIRKNGSSKLMQPPKFNDVKLLKISNLLGSVNSNSSWVLRSHLLSDDIMYPANYQAIDWATTLSMRSSYKVVINTQRLYLYRQHGLQMTKNQDYRMSAFSEIYPLWSKLNLELNLPELSMDQASRIAAPWATNSLKEKFPMFWVKKFIELSEVLNSPDRTNCLKLLARRRIQ